MMTIDFALRLASLTAEPSTDAAGDTHRLARVERTRTEMMVQGTIIQATLRETRAALIALARTLRQRDLRRVVIAGCGDSWFIGMGVRHAFERLLGVPLEPAQALDFAHYGAETVDGHTLVVGISAGGNTPAVMAALEAARRRGAFALGLSNSAGSPILTSFDGGLVVPATRKGWPTQSSTATIALLIALAATLAGGDEGEAMLEDLARLAGTMDRLMLDLDPAVAAAAQGCAARGIVLFAGLGPNYAAACFGAAKVKELSPVHALAMQLEEYHHYRSQKAGDALVLVATDPASRERALDTALVSEKVGGRLIAILAAPDVEIERRAAVTVMVPAIRPELLALVSSLPLHLFAYHFAKSRDAIGLGAA